MHSQSAAVEAAFNEQPIELIHPVEAIASKPFIEWAILSFLAASAAYMFYFSSRRIFSFDEMLSYFTEQIHGTGALLRVQSSIPVSLDPPLYHLLGHWALQLRLNASMAVRLPSLVGSMFMLAGVYLFTRRLAGSYVAGLAIGGLIIAEDLHMIEARPYGVLLGAAGLALLLWQNVLRDRWRGASLLGLFLALGVATSSHYFGILVALPFLVVECIRAMQRRRLDLPLSAALLGSYLFAAAWLPFLKAAHQYKAAYYTRVHFIDLVRAYSSIVDASLHVRSALLDVVIAFVVVVLLVCGVYLGSKISARSEDRRHEWMLVFLLALLPIAGVVLAAAASGAFETRYVVEFAIGLSIAISALLMSSTQSKLIKILFLLLCAILIAGRFYRDARQNAQQYSVLEALSRHTDSAAPTILADNEEFVRLHYYYPAQASNVKWVADMDREIALSGTDNIDRTMLNLRHFTDLPVITYGDLKQDYKSFALIESKVTLPPNWLVRQLRRDGASFRVVAAEGDLTYSQVALSSR
ncbi:MAG TPA: glycosyltransferase family 39 protein [Acidisarcina sp.]